jgi:hypothetical protein
MPHRRLFALTVGLVLVGCAGPAPSSTMPPPPAVTDAPGVIPSSNGSIPPSAPSGAISREAAIAAALRSASGATSATRVTRADIAPDPFVSHDVPPGGTPLPESGLLSWVVRLDGGGLLGLPCGTSLAPIRATGSAVPCIDEGGRGGYEVVLDVKTGALRGWAF